MEDVRNRIRNELSILINIREECERKISNLEDELSATFEVEEMLDSFLREE